MDARKLAKEYRRTLNEDILIYKSNIICDTIMQLRIFKETDILYAYMDVNHEVCLKSLINKAFSMNKTVAFPKVIGKNMVFFKVNDLGELHKGYMNIPEPDVIEENIISGAGLMIMPGLAFDYKFQRAGYGAGYYDRFLAQNTENHIFKIGVAFEKQMVDELITDPFDIKADMIVTENNIYTRKA